MAEVISIRVFVFFVAFFALRFVMLAAMPGAKRWHALVLLGVSSLIAFVLSALILDDSMGDTLLAWAVIFGIIALLWTAQWKGQEYRRFRDELMARDEVVERAVERRERGERGDRAGKD
jgi:hypothetical protein